MQTYVFYENRVTARFQLKIMWLTVAIPEKNYEGGGHIFRVDSLDDDYDDETQVNEDILDSGPYIPSAHGFMELSVSQLLAFKEVA